eukprot:gene26449-33029_t
MSVCLREKQLTDLFQQFGKVLHIEVRKSKEEFKFQGYGFVTMSTLEEAQSAMAGLNGLMTRQQQHGLGFVHYPLTVAGVLAVKRALHHLGCVSVEDVSLDTGISVTLEKILRERPELNVPYIPDGLAYEPVYSSSTRKFKTGVTRQNLFISHELPFTSLSSLEHFIERPVTAQMGPANRPSVAQYAAAPQQQSQILPIYRGIPTGPPQPPLGSPNVFQGIPGMHINRHYNPQKAQQSLVYVSHLAEQQQQQQQRLAQQPPHHWSQRGLQSQQYEQQQGAYGSPHNRGEWPESGSAAYQQQQQQFQQRDRGFSQTGSPPSVERRKSPPQPLTRRISPPSATFQAQLEDQRFSPHHHQQQQQMQMQQMRPQQDLSQGEAQQPYGGYQPHPQLQRQDFQQNQQQFEQQSLPSPYGQNSPHQQHQISEERMTFLREQEAQRKLTELREKHLAAEARRDKYEQQKILQRQQNNFELMQQQQRGGGHMPMTELYAHDTYGYQDHQQPPQAQYRSMMAETQQEYRNNGFTRPASLSFSHHSQNHSAASSKHTSPSSFNTNNVVGSGVNRKNGGFENELFESLNGPSPKGVHHSLSQSVDSRHNTPSNYQHQQQLQQCRVQQDRQLSRDREPPFIDISGLTSGMQSSSLSFVEPSGVLRGWDSLGGGESVEQQQHHEQQQSFY